MCRKFHYPRPEFSVDVRKVSGVPLGRLYLPYPWASKPEFLDLLASVHIYEVKPYPNGAKVAWFVAPTFEYRRLVLLYPHSYYGDSTLELLNAASTLFSRLKSRPDFDYRDSD